MQVAEVRADADATVPAYLGDTQAMPVAGMDEALALLSSAGERVREPAPGVRVYRLNDGLDLAAWELFQAGSDYAPRMIRRRRVSDGKKALRASTGVCGSTDPAVCKRFGAMLRAPGRQRSIPPPPTPADEAR